MKAAQNFLERFRYVWEKHMASKYRSSRLVWYMLGGDPHLASEFARWIVDFDERLVDEGEESSGVLHGFVFTSKTITLDEHHGDDVKIGLREAMEYITSECD